MSRILQGIETAGGRNALDFVLSEGKLLYPYCKTALDSRTAGGTGQEDDQRTIEPSMSGSSPREEEQHSHLAASPGLISPLWRSETSTVLFACLFTDYTPQSIDVTVATRTFKTIVQALTPALNNHFELERERSDNQVQKILVSGLGQPAVLISADRHILGHTPNAVEHLVGTGAAERRDQKLVIMNKQVEAALQVLHAELHSRSPETTDCLDCVDELDCTGNIQSVCISVRDGALKRISIEPVSAFSTESTEEDAIWYLIRLSDTADLPEEIEGVLQEHYDLSQSEARLARQLTLTGSMEVTATSLSITRNTAKTHLRRIYEKTGVHTQLQLAGLVHKLAGLF
ncbi:helix-turn-helix transcriptional regulator [Roseibium sp. SCP14]|uniref:helix-turn-helix transcriptional regulator n=1 Tax=Roseibium sp. SCP14 TaxID=3141375 RepID=UPI003337A1C2